MTNTKKNATNTSKINKTILFLIPIISAVNFFISTIKMCFSLFVFPILRYLIPQSIRSAIIRYLPLMIRSFITPLSLLIFQSLNRYFTARSKVLQLREKIEMQKQENEEKGISDDIDIDTGNLCYLKEAEDELYHIPGESIAAITGAGIILVATGPISIFATAAATTLGYTLGNLTYGTMAFAYCKLRGTPNTSAYAKTIELTQEMIWENNQEDLMSDKSPRLKPFN